MRDSLASIGISDMFSSASRRSRRSGEGVGDGAGDGVGGAGDWDGGATMHTAGGDGGGPGHCTLCLPLGSVMQHVKSRQELVKDVDPNPLPPEPDVLAVYRGRRCEVTPSIFVWLCGGQQRPRACVTRRSIFGLPVPQREGRVLRGWRFLMLLIDLTYTAFFLPVSMAVVERFTSQATHWIDAIAGAFFLLDFLLSFHLPWTITCCHQSAQIDNGAGIAYLYRTKGTLWVDLVSVLPFVAQWFIALIEHKRVLWLLSFIFVLRLLRLVRIASIVKALARGQLTPRSSSRWMSASGWYICSILYCAVVGINLLAALWYLSARFQTGGICWLQQPGPRGDISDETLARRYLAALYFTVSTITTTGFGDIVPTTELEELVAIFMMLVATLFMSFIIGTVGGLLSQRSIESQRAARYVSKVAFLDRWFQRNPTPPALERSIYQYYSCEWTRATEEDEVFREVTEGLPAGLRGQLVRASLAFSLPESMRLLTEGIPDLIVHELCAMLDRSVVGPHAIVCTWQAAAPHAIFFLEYGQATHLPAGIRVVAAPETPAGVAYSGAPVDPEEDDGDGASPGVIHLAAPRVFPPVAVRELARRVAIGGGVGVEPGCGVCGACGSRLPPGPAGPLLAAGAAGGRGAPVIPPQDAAAVAADGGCDRHDVVWSKTMCVVWRLELAPLVMLCHRCPQLVGNLRAVAEAQEQRLAGLRRVHAASGRGRGVKVHGGSGSHRRPSQQQQQQQQHRGPPHRGPGSAERAHQQGQTQQQPQQLQEHPPPV